MAQTNRVLGNPARKALGPDLVFAVRRFGWRAPVVLLALLCEMGFNALAPLSLRYVIDSAILPRNFHLLVLILSVLAVAAIIASGAGFARDYLYSRGQSRFLADLRESLFEHIQQLSVESIGRIDKGEILARFSNDVAAVENAASMAIPWAILPLLEAIASSILLILLSWRLALLGLLVWPWTILAPRLFSHRAVNAAFDRKSSESQLLNNVQENLAAQPIVKAFNYELHSIDKFRLLSARVYEHTAHSSFLSSLLERCTTAGILLLQVIVLGASAWFAFQGKLTVGTLVSFQALLIMLSNSLTYVVQYTPSIVQARSSMHRIHELLGIRSTISDSPEARDLLSFDREIRFSDVSFGYSASRLSLANVSFAIPHGFYAALVGESGSGKSTALKLLMRFYEPQSGAILLDDAALPDIKQSSLRKLIGVVFQESFLFNISVRENILVGNPQASDEQIWDSCKAAGIHDTVIRLPNGYETVVGEGGGSLSGGQRQRLAIARALVKDPAILLLDEATSALDPATEAELNETLCAIARQRTVVSVTHRLKSAKDANFIFVFQGGRLIESGHHDQLLESGGYYCRLWQKQTGFSVAADGLQVGIEPKRLGLMPLFQDLGLEALEELAAWFRTDIFHAGDKICRQNDPGDKFYVIVRGVARVMKTDDRNPGEQIIATLQDGDHFGEIALLTGEARTATVEAVTDCTCISLERARFISLFKSRPELWNRINRSALERLESNQEASASKLAPYR